MSSEDWIDISNFLNLKKGELADFDFNDKKIVIMNINGVFYATDRICTHAYVDLATGFLNESQKTITCPLHLSSFDVITGTALNLPAEKPLKAYKLKRENKKLYILI